MKNGFETVASAAARLGKSHRQIRRLCLDGKIPALKFGNPGRGSVWLVIMEKEKDNATGLDIVTNRQDGSPLGPTPPIRLRSGNANGNKSNSKK
jgi:hypothetical protein